MTLLTDLNAATQSDITSDSEQSLWDAMEMFSDQKSMQHLVVLNKSRKLSK
jgi:hypothetical protein